MRGDRPSIVLVHGAFHGGWCWRDVVDHIHDAGARAFAPTLMGLADRQTTLSARVDLSAHIEEVVNMILWQDLFDVILCGHSYGGMVISGVAERIADRIGHLVYLDALKPEPMTCLWDYMAEEERTYFEDNSVGDLISPIPAAVFKVNDRDSAWVDSKCTPQPRATFFERLGNTNRRKALPKTYVYASLYANPLMARFAQEAGEAPDWDVVTMPYGHDLMIDASAEVADLLLAKAMKSTFYTPKN